MGLGFFKNKIIMLMKRIFTLFIAIAGILTANAQSTGFYHVKNTYTDRYMMMTDNSKGGSVSGSPDLAAITSTKNKDVAFTHPGAVCYIVSVGGGKYDVQAQNTGLHSVAGIYGDVKANSDGTYSISGTYSGITIKLGDKLNGGSENSWLVEAGSNNGKWSFLAIDNNTEYIGIKPDVKDGDGNYWGTMYCGFAFKLHSSGMKAYYVDNANTSNFSLTEWTNDVIPANMQIIIKCSSSDYSNNKIKPVTDKASEPSYGKYQLYGVYFDRGKDESGDKHINHKAYDSNTMRVIGVNGGKLVFEKASSSYLTDGAYLPHNKAYLEVPSGSNATLTQGTVGIQNITADNKQINEGTYNLTGQKIPDGGALRPGIYIQNGKKFVVK